MIIQKNTPIENYLINGREVFVKREDLSSLPPAPALAKLRGVYNFLEGLKEKGINKFGVYDTRLSKAGWGCSAVANEIGGIEIINFYPDLKEYNHKTPENQSKVLELGHKVYGLKGGRTAILYARAKKIMKEMQAYPMPMGLVLKETVEEVSIEAKTIDEKYLGGDLIVCVGTGMILAGIIKGIGNKFNRIYGISAGMNIEKQKKRIKSVIEEIPDNVEFIMSEKDYYYEDFIVTPFPCSPYYDKKAYRWMIKNLKYLKDTILFWNIGV